MNIKQKGPMKKRYINLFAILFEGHFYMNSLMYNNCLVQPGRAMDSDSSPAECTTCVGIMAWGRGGGDCHQLQQ